MLEGRAYTPSDHIVVRVFKIIMWTVSAVFWWPLWQLKLWAEYHDHQWLVRSITQVPNAIGVARLLTAPIAIYHCWWLVAYHQPAPFPGTWSDTWSVWDWFWVIFAEGLSDGMDGHIARETWSRTPTGQWLDPLADKVMFACLAIGYVLVTFKLESAWLGLLAAVVTLLVFWPEYKLVSMSLRQTGPLLTQFPPDRRPEAGANMYGKVKFTAELASALFAFLALVPWWPDRPWIATLLFCSCLVMATPYAHKSYAGQRSDLEQFRREFARLSPTPKEREPMKLEDAIEPLALLGGVVLLAVLGVARRRWRRQAALANWERFVRPAGRRQGQAP